MAKLAQLLSKGVWYSMQHYNISLLCELLLSSDRFDLLKLPSLIFKAVFNLTLWNDPQLPS